MPRIEVIARQHVTRLACEDEHQGMESLLLWRRNVRLEELHEVETP